MLLLFVVSCSRHPAATEHVGLAPTSDDLFVWDRPTRITNNVPVTRSATCRFKQGFATSFYAERTDGQPNSPERIHYSQSNENEADTAAFVDPDTKRPKVQSNGGQADLIRIGDAGEQLTLLNIGRDSSGTELYSISWVHGTRHTQTAKKNSVFVGPLGVSEMGYCN